MAWVWCNVGGKRQVRTQTLWASSPKNRAVIAVLPLQLKPLRIQSHRDIRACSLMDPSARVRAPCVFRSSRRKKDAI